MDTPSEISEKQEPRKASEPVDIPSKEPHIDRRWGMFLPKSENSSDSSDGMNFLLSASRADTTTTVATQDESS